MPRQPDREPEKYCERCGHRLHRKRFRSHLEDMCIFKKRRFCSLRCANSRGIRSVSFGAQHQISKRFNTGRCELCGRTRAQVRLHVHHINKDWRDHRPENLRTLCTACHLRGHCKKPPKPCLHCSRQARNRGMCGKHYQRWKKYGSGLLTKLQRAGAGLGYVLSQAQ